MQIASFSIKNVVYFDRFLSNDFFFPSYFILYFDYKSLKTSGNWCWCTDFSHNFPNCCCLFTQKFRPSSNKVARLDEFRAAARWRQSNLQRFTSSPILHLKIAFVCSKNCPFPSNIFLNPLFPLFSTLPLYNVFIGVWKNLKSLLIILCSFFKYALEAIICIVGRWFVRNFP